jgi:ElaB/YqjD/DUF883 family membrane-anchored ribosome-binding protein
MLSFVTLTPKIMLEELQTLETEADKLLGDHAHEARNKIQRAREFVFKFLNAKEEGRETIAQEERCEELLDEAFNYIQIPKNDKEILRDVRNELIKLSL